MSKYPFIANKKLYAAVMFACKMIREDGFFNKAVDRAANYYGVDVEDVKKEVRLRQSAGQSGKPRGKMKWFIVCDNRGDIYYNTLSNFRIKRGKTSETVKRRNESWGEFCYHMESDTHDDIEVVGEYETKKEAEENFRLETIEEWLKGLNLCGEIVCRINSQRGLAEWDKAKKKFVFEGVKI